MRVLFLGSYHREADRNRILIRGLREQGVEVMERRFPMTSLHFRGAGLPLARVLSRAALSLPAYIRFLSVAGKAAREADVIFIGYLGHHDLAALSTLRRLRLAPRQRPVVFDPFFSLYDTIVSDRRLLRADSRAASLLRRFERWVMQQANLVLADTAAHAAFYARLAGLPESRLRVVPLGVDEEYFPPRDPPPPREWLHVLFYGNYIPLHGVPTILEAAELLRHERIRFRLIGTGQTRRKADAFAAERRLANVEFVDRVSLRALADEIANAHIVLGIFGTSAKASRVIPTKVYQGLSVGRCVITRDSPAIRELLTPGEHLVTCPAGSARALADAIMTLKQDPTLLGQFACASQEVSRKRFYAAAIGDLAVKALEETVRGRNTA